MRLHLSGDRARIAKIEATVDGVKVSLELETKPEFVRELSCYPYVAAERAAYEAIVAEWQRDHKAPWDEVCAQIAAMHEASVRVARANGDPEPPAPNPPDLVPCPDPVESTRTLAEVSDEYLAIWLSDLRIAGTVLGKPKLVTRGFASVLTVRLALSVDDEMWAELRSALGVWERAWAEQRDIEELTSQALNAAPAQGVIA